MTLTPESRVLLTDALRPPSGYRVDVAVGTSYSLNLTALLLAPLSFALFDEMNTQALGEARADDIRGIDPIRVLEAVRRYAARTTVFCQAGGIHVPRAYRSILTFIEDSVTEVLPFHEGSIFHPKVWALRFAAPDGGMLHRLVVLSRNLTLDRSWDTALVLDEDPDGPIDAAPAAQFVRSLPSLTLRPIAAERMSEIDSLIETLEDVRLGVPAPFTSGELLPIGLNDDRVWPFSQGERLLAISPFLSKPAISGLGRMAPNRTLVSRADSLHMVGAKALDGWDSYVLQRLAEVDPGDDSVELPAEKPDGFLEVRDGLHAKTFVVDEPGGQSTVVTGSANLTSETWGTNAEFDVALHGPTKTCGVAAVLDGATTDVPGLSRILEQYTVTDQEGTTDEAIETAYALERFHQQLAAGGLVLDISESKSAVDEKARQVSATLTLTVPPDPPGQTTIWPASLAGAQHGHPLAAKMTWSIAPIHVTPFIAVQTTAGDGAARATRLCVIKAELTGDIDGRRQDAVFSILDSPEKVLRYLAFLLGDPSYDALFAQLAGLDDEKGSGWERRAMGGVDIALFEPMVRAIGRDEDALARVASLVEDLRALPEGRKLVPEGFDELWDVVWQVHQEMKS